MLDTDTKRRIDTARDILVGKVPDPKSQSRADHHCPDLQVHGRHGCRERGLRRHAQVSRRGIRTRRAGGPEHEKGRRGTWLEHTVRQQLAAWEKPALLALVKDLYETDAENRDFIHARCSTGEGGGEALEKYRGKVVDPFFPAKGYGQLKLGVARKAIRDYRKATGDLRGTAELLMTYVENGTRFTKEYGDIDDRFYSSVESALEELASLLRGQGRRLYPGFSERLASVEQMTQHTGSGYHDFVVAVVRQLEEEFIGL